MVTEHLVILELIAFLIVVLLISTVVWRDKSKRIEELNDLNDELMYQLEELQGLMGEYKEGDDVLHQEVDKLSDELDQQILHSIDDSEEKWSQMERLMGKNTEQVDAINELLENEEIDKAALEKEIASLKKMLLQVEKKVKVQVKETKIARKNSKSLKQQLKELSKKLIGMGSLELKEARLLKDKERLKKRLADFKAKLESQKFINNKLEQDLKTSFRGDEVQAIRDTLKQTEEDLRQAITEKKFIEKHFIDLEENTKDEAELHSALQRANREIQMLEKTVMEIDQEAKD